MQGEQRGAKDHCSGTTDNLLIDRMVCQDRAPKMTSQFEYGMDKREKSV